jgi:hypothetical protein
VTVNPYLVMPLDQVKADARNGVRLAVEAWRQRDPDGAARELHPIVEPGQERERADRTRRILAAVGDYQRGQKDSGQATDRESRPDGGEDASGDHSHNGIEDGQV